MILKVHKWKVGSFFYYEFSDFDQLKTSKEGGAMVINLLNFFTVKKMNFEILTFIVENRKPFLIYSFEF